MQPAKTGLQDEGTYTIFLSLLTMITRSLQSWVWGCGVFTNRNSFYKVNWMYGWPSSLFYSRCYSIPLVQTHIRSHTSQPDIQSLPHYYFKNTALRQLNCKVSGDEVGLKIFLCANFVSSCISWSLRYWFERDNQFIFQQEISRFIFQGAQIKLKNLPELPYTE